MHRAGAYLMKGGEMNQGGDIDTTGKDGKGKKSKGKSGKDDGK